MGDGPILVQRMMSSTPGSSTIKYRVERKAGILGLAPSEALRGCARGRASSMGKRARERGGLNERRSLNARDGGVFPPGYPQVIQVGVVGDGVGDGRGSRVVLAEGS